MRWDVFVSHASEDKEAVVEPLVQALEDAGLSVWYDRIVLTLGDSLRERIDEGLAHSRFGIVILSPSFFAKHWPTKELNGLAQREVDGRKVILPTWYDITAEEVRQQSPMLADRVAARWSDGLQSVVAAILEVVRGDAAERVQATRPAPTRRVSVADYSSLVLIASHEGKNLFIQSESVEVTEGLKAVLLPANARESAFLVELRDGWSKQVFVVYDLNAFSGRIQSLSQRRSGNKDSWTLLAIPEEPAHQMEMAFDNMSADEIAELRARRILLDEKLPKSGRHSDLNDSMLDVFVRGSHVSIEVPRSPLPALYRDLRKDCDLFLAAARLVSVLWLRMSGTIEHVFELDLRFQDDAALAVRFEGQRRREYRNVEPTIMRVEGSCPLT